MPSILCKRWAVLNPEELQAAASIFWTETSSASWLTHSLISKTEPANAILDLSWMLKKARVRSADAQTHPKFALTPRLTVETDPNEGSASLKTRL